VYVQFEKRPSASTVPPEDMEEYENTYLKDYEYVSDTFKRNDSVSQGNGESMPVDE